ncbi:MAG: GTP-binding protein [Caldilineaceae bacterium]
MTDGASVGSGADGQLPVLILGGYLGSGKTTLLNRLLRQQHGLRLAVLVNDFGSINVDAALVESSHGETIALTNGCICCGMADGFVRVMYRLRERAQQLDGVIVETSGVADPAQTAAYATLPGESPAAVIVLVDAERVQKLARDPLIGRAIHRQLDAADVAIITKGDLAGPSRVAEIGTWIKTVHPAARVIATPADEAPIALLFEVMQPAEGSELHTAYSRQAPTGAAAHADHDKLYERAVAIPQNPVTESELRR